MKQYLIAGFVLAMAITGSQPAIACDVCGAGGGNNYIGVLPEFNSKIIGIRYKYSGLQTHLGAGQAVSYLTTEERYRTAELWAAWNIKHKYRVMASLPLTNISKENKVDNASFWGMGDATVSAYYALLKKRTLNAKGRPVMHELWSGIGLKLPTGQYNPANKSETAESANLFQLGTGSTDFIATVLYDRRMRNWGINLSAYYKMNTENKYGYWYGNKLSFSAQAYRKWDIAPRLNISPNLGLQAETASRDFNSGFQVDVSGGQVLWSTAGAEINYKKFAVGTNWQAPLVQNLANKFIHARSKAMVHIAYVL